MELTLSQLSSFVAESIRRNPYTQNVWVAAELSDVRVSGGHCYMELVEKNDAGTTVAKVRATIWASKLYPLRHKFLNATGRDISTGLKVLLRGSVSHHAVYGLSFNVNDIDPSYTLGDIERLRREILTTLDKEGVLEMNRRLVMNEVPQRIAVISAAGAAGYGDFMRQLENNPDGFVFYPVLYPAVMQGEHTSASVRAALEQIEMAIDLWDCVAILRGGGATTDLNGFDDLQLARAVAKFPIPVVVGIGHERDRTVLDEIAHTRVKTPTAAAAFFIDKLRTAYTRACNGMNTIVRYVTDRISGEQRNLANLRSIVTASAPSRLASSRQSLLHIAELMPSLTSRRIAGARIRLQVTASAVALTSARRCEREHSKTKHLARSITEAVRYRLHNAEEQLKAKEQLVNALSPSETLKRGYSITRIENRAVKSASELKAGDIVTTTLFNGKIKSTIIENGI